MRILITGGTGLIGRHLCKVLLDEGYELTVFSRNAASVAERCGAGVRPRHGGAEPSGAGVAASHLLPQSAGFASNVSEVHALAALSDWKPDMAFDAVINLAGEPIVDARWTESRKQVLRDSRIALTGELVQRIAAAEHKPAVLLSGSAIGYYGGRGDEELGEDSGAGTDFPAQLCMGWEAAASAAERYGVRVCLLRTGLILSTDGGLLARMALPFKMGMGTRLGDGRQWMSWIHIDDYVALVLRLLRDEQMRGAYNMTAPAPVTNKEFTAVLAAVLHRPAAFVVPASLLKLSLGESASLLLEGQRVLPKRMLAAGQTVRFEKLEGALKDLFG